MTLSHHAFSVAVAFAAIGCPAPCSAHVGNTVYFALEIPDSLLPDLHDGTLADWERLFAVPVLTDSDFVSLNIGDGAPIGAPDLSARIYLGWHRSTNRLYAAIERLDDAYVTRMNLP